MNARPNHSTFKGVLMRMLGNIPRFPKLPAPWSNQTVTYVDVGARGGPPDKWLKLTGQIEYICFEPDREEAALLARQFDETAGFSGSVYGKALGAGDTVAQLNLTRFRPSSSLLEPNHALLQRFEVAPFFEVEKTVPVTLVSLDSELAALGRHCDFMKVDVQGYELEVLRGAKNNMDRSIGCELEVSFLEIYRDQPLFAEVDAFMRSQNFFLADLERVWWLRADMPKEFQSRGSLAYGNAVYLSNRIVEPQSRTEALKSMLVCVAAGLNEPAFEALESSFKAGLITTEERSRFVEWLSLYCRQNNFWIHLARMTSRLPGRQTLGRWAGLWSRTLQGFSHTSADSESWLRRTSW